MIQPQRCSSTVRNILNQKIKHREDFRPFAPSVMAERADEWFEVGARFAMEVKRSIAYSILVGA
jgi:predicted NodU family carbamoyl transferase